MDEVRGAVGELLDRYTVGEASREEVEQAYGKIRTAVLKRHPRRPQTPADGSPEAAVPNVISLAAPPPRAETTGTTEASEAQDQRCGGTEPRHPDRKSVV